MKLRTNIRSLFPTFLIYSLVIPLLAHADAALPETNWPPKIGSEYPNLQLLNADGKSFSLNSLKGKVIIIELSAMSCPATQAFSGAHRFGGFRGISPQPGLPSFEEVFERYSDGLKIKGDPDLAFVQIVFYDMNLKAPAPQELRDWISHFKLSDLKNAYILAAPAALTNVTSRSLIPGFHLLDKKFVLRNDASGTARQPLLFSELIPAVGNLVSE